VRRRGVAVWHYLGGQEPREAAPEPRRDTRFVLFSTVALTILLDMAVAGATATRSESHAARSAPGVERAISNLVPGVTVPRVVSVSAPTPHIAGGCPRVAVACSST
jgi:hypothetical protein